MALASATTFGRVALTAFTEAGDSRASRLLLLQPLLGEGCTYCTFDGRPLALWPHTLRPPPSLKSSAVSPQAHDNSTDLPSCSTRCAVEGSAGPAVSESEGLIPGSLDSQNSVADEV